MRTLVGLGAIVLLGACSRSPAGQLDVSPFVPVKKEPPPPLKVLIAINASPSFNVSDPSGQRAAAVVSLLSNLPPDASILVSAFSSSVIANFSPSGIPEFTPLAQFTAADRAALVQKITNFGPPGTMTNVTDFVTPLRAISDALTADLARPESWRYEVLFVTDGAPTNDEDQTLLCSPLISGLASLSLPPNDIHLNTVFINQAQVAPCNDAVVETRCSIQPAPSGCPASIRAADELRLRRMAELGNGSFKSFRSGDAVDYAPLLVH